MTSDVATFRPTALSSPPVSSYVIEGTPLDPTVADSPFCPPRRKEHAVANVRTALFTLLAAVGCAQSRILARPGEERAGF